MFSLIELHSGLLALFRAVCSLVPAYTTGNIHRLRVNFGGHALLKTSQLKLKNWLPYGW